MKRRAHSLLSVWVTLASVAVLALWAASYGFPGRLGWTDPGAATWFLGSGGGSVRISRQAATATRGDGLTFLRFDTARYGVVAMRTQYGPAGVKNLDMMPARTYGFVGITLADHRDVFPHASAARSPVVTTSLTTVSLSYPVLFLAAVAVPLGAQWVRLRRRVRAGREGRCPSCGYDIRATPECCPECGVRPSDPVHLGALSRYGTALVAGVFVAAVASIPLSPAAVEFALPPLPWELWVAVRFICLLLPFVAGAMAARRVLRRWVPRRDVRP